MTNASMAILKLSGSEESVEFLSHYHYFHIQNRSSSDISVSNQPDISGRTDGVIVIPAGGSVTIHSYDDQNTFYISGTGDVNVMASDSDNNPYQSAAGGGGSTVTASETNGAISVDGKDVTVYDDTGVVKVDESGKISADYMPSYVDDAIEVPDIQMVAEGERGKIYVDLATDKTYRWSGTQFTEISKSDVVTASSENGNIKINGRETTVYNDSELRLAITNLVTKESLVLSDTDVQDIMEEAITNVPGTIQNFTDGFNDSVLQLDKQASRRQAEYLEALNSEHSTSSSFTE